MATERRPPSSPLSRGWPHSTILFYADVRAQYPMTSYIHTRIHCIKGIDSKLASVFNGGIFHQQRKASVRTPWSMRTDDSY